MPLSLALRLFPGAASASAGSEDSTEAVESVDCPGYVFQHFPPGRKLLPQNIRGNAEGSFGPCVTTSPDHAFAEYLAAKAKLCCPAPPACPSSVLPRPPAGATLPATPAGHPTSAAASPWPNAQREKTSSPSSPVIATIDSGDFAGSRMIFALLNTDLAKCLTTGIELVAGPTDLTILSLWLTP
ncbi:hypothetical protein [Streptomyces fumanus]|uniref:Uncharacterized protein n=1 Tax=Streptomyces fumanus TaxID=67302 RepID=A0A919AX73_9ACTN|nr:hypothetical protein [Streptomyces fumanus]GHF27860.1 hypothetical protein GCM10018772_61870 [Streptomyces fumanus]